MKTNFLRLRNRFIDLNSVEQLIVRGHTEKIVVEEGVPPFGKDGKANYLRDIFVTIFLTDNKPKIELTFNENEYDQYEELIRTVFFGKERTVQEFNEASTIANSMAWQSYCEKVYDEFD